MNNDKIDLNELWGMQPVPLPDKNVVFQKINQVKKRNIRNLIFITGLLGLTSLFITWIWITYNPQLLLTKIGIILCLLAMAIFALMYNQQYPILKKLNAVTNNQNYLQNLLQLKKHQRFMHSTALNLYFILLFLGIMLYLVEFTQRMQITFAVVTYLLTISWVLFAWFYLRPRQIKKQQAQLNEVIDKIQTITKQVTEE